MLLDLQQVPKTQQDWDVWAFSHRDHHTIIRQAIQAQKGVSLIEYVLDPVTLFDQPGWLERNAQTHTDMNAAIGAQGSDLEDVDLTNAEQLADWINNHYLEHQTAAQILRI